MSDTLNRTCQARVWYQVLPKALSWDADGRGKPRINQIISLSVFFRVGPRPQGAP